MLTLFNLVVPLQWGKAVNRRAYKAIFKGLCGCDAVLDDRSGEGHSWCGGSDADAALSYARKHNVFQIQRTRVGLQTTNTPFVGDLTFRSIA
jgi:hypothetical protein